MSHAIVEEEAVLSSHRGRPVATAASATVSLRVVHCFPEKVLHSRFRLAINAPAPLLIRGARRLGGRPIRCNVLARLALVELLVPVEVHIRLCAFAAATNAAIFLRVPQRHGRSKTWSHTSIRAPTPEIVGLASPSVRRAPLRASHAVALAIPAIRPTRSVLTILCEHLRDIANHVVSKTIHGQFLSLAARSAARAENVRPSIGPVHARFEALGRYAENPFGLIGVVHAVNCEGRGLHVRQRPLAEEALPWIHRVGGEAILVEVGVATKGFLGFRDPPDL
eukprot:CAMPEP_0117532296 /NCGR_PEP_ID=MMETSP0784-20121206/39294_1 /TAXON_ID=39447 /ORGANISM="" /LENGTH=279 /DNA_ID=CAMNT_0005328683 /DNA_START=126 /DNA_END=965 /DNA_ORIENTATION=-